MPETACLASYRFGSFLREPLGCCVELVGVEPYFKGFRGVSGFRGLGVTCTRRQL